MNSFPRLRAVLQNQPVMPVLRIERAEDAAPLARALAKGGLPAVEITLRTPQALEAIRRVVAEVPEAVVGAGTILNPKHFAQAVEAGATFIVSPGQTPALFDAAADSDVPLLPGATSASEIMMAAERGYEILKFFPAEQAGGAAFLKSLASPFQGIQFCPTGGITPSNAGTYLGLPNVICVGGSWIAPDALIASGAWDQITALAAEAAKLKTA
ncbi:2-dehydro-3-deoxy-phosphogluconate aldolase [Tianweitania sp. BSSL-BM11]|uniref:2-dehydro-3-deoxy-phosphogluconate aldolase n=1 Tax=Tianweitania aestuarii TaxID=2814886 RepID=A0ABS5RVH4_9HYPH|nr:2-dehydro-3-deoxy-phosphogluconate aldolase [Tianweitania aestuarii]MBS9721009.1 2-dehydro-3-deoxy-phosphogluconate aldolase [Tianweitania aestuarii]